MYNSISNNSKMGDAHCRFIESIALFLCRLKILCKEKCLFNNSC